MASSLSRNTEVRDLAEALSLLEEERGRRRVAEAQLNRRYDRLVNDLSTDCFIYATDTQGVVTFASPSLEKVLGYPLAEVIGTNWRNFADTASPTFSIVEEEELAVTTGADSPPKLIALKRADGQPILLEVSPRPLFDSVGEVIGIEGICKDVTHLNKTKLDPRLIQDELETRVRRRTAELEYRVEFEQLLVSLSTGFINLPIEAIDDGLGDALRRIGEFTKVDRCFLYQIDTGGATASLTHEWRRAETPTLRDRLQRIPIDRFSWEASQLASGQPLQFEDTAQLPSEAREFGALYKDLGIRSALNVPLLSGERLLGMLGLSTVRQPRHWPEEHVALVRVLAEVLRNTLERSRIERALQESRERLRLTIEGVEEGFYDWNVQTGDVLYSEYWLRTLGLRPGDIENSVEGWRKLVHPDDRPIVEAALASHVAGQTRVYEAEYRCLHADGRYLWRLDRGRVILRNESGEALRMVGVNRDITPVIEAREARQRMQAQLAHLGRVTAMGETVAGIAHEVNQPLHAAATFNAAARGALRSGNLDKAESLSQKSSEQISRAGGIIRRLREFTKPRPAEIVPIDLNQLVRRSAEFVLSYNRGARVSLRFRFDEALPNIQGDPIQLQQVVVNLLQNGIDAVLASETPDALILISTHRDGNMLMLELQDNGVGCQLEDPEQMFDAFISTKAEGMGIGLSLCRTILQSHHGSITASQNEAAGMTFTVRIPLMEAPSS
jgi:PAS domain S-box-containing protein